MIAMFHRFSFLALLCTLLMPSLAHAQQANSDNWFQLEVTVFTYEDANLELENWSPSRLSIGFPERLRRLQNVSDALQLADWAVLAPDLNPLTTLAPLDAALTQEPASAGPAPYSPQAVSFRLPDVARTAFLQLPPEVHDFLGTNRAITQSAAHRIVFHGVWRQVLGRRSSASAIAVMGGRAFNERREVEGSLTFYLTNSGDRVILESNLWLNRFGTQELADNPWKLPVLPDILRKPLEAVDAETNQTPYFVNRIIQLQQNRDLRVDEFHYIDHPAMGILVQVTPYTLPPLPLPPVDSSTAPLSTSQPPSP